jgi:transposase
MNIAPGFIGIEVCKDYLDIYDGGTRRIANTAAAVTAYVKTIAPDGLVLFEATGRYDACLRQALGAAQIRYARVNPAQARAFARARGKLAKTDSIDARVLAEMAQALQPAPDQQPDARRQQLAELSRRRDQLVDIRQMERNRRHAATEPLVLADIRTHLAFLDAAIKAFEAQITDLIKAVDELARDQRLLRSIPGIGPVAATTLMALMPETGNRSPKAIAALAGLAPRNCDSGQFRGKRTIGGGRSRVRTALYMAAVTAIRHAPRFARLYAIMIVAGKAPKVVLIAVARKLLLIANAILRDKQPFRA